MQVLMPSVRLLLSESRAVRYYPTSFRSVENIPSKPHWSPFIRGITPPIHHTQSPEDWERESNVIDAVIYVITSTEDRIQAPSEYGRAMPGRDIIPLPR